MMSGSVLAYIELIPRMFTEPASAPGVPVVPRICRPATEPTRAFMTLVVWRLARSSDLMTVAEPVKASFFVVPKATTSTSSMAVMSSFMRISIVVFPATGIFCVSYPMNDTFR